MVELFREYGDFPADLEEPRLQHGKLRCEAHAEDLQRRSFQVCCSPLHPWIVRRVGVHGRAAVIDRFGAQFVVPEFVAVDLA